MDSVPSHNGLNGTQQTGPGGLFSTEDSEYTGFLDALQRLRELNVHHVHDLPQIIVCGETSVGKSSVLEAIIQVPFRRRHGICTRYVTQVTIQPKSPKSITFRIEPDATRPEHEIASLKAFPQFGDGPNSADDIVQMMEMADREIFSGSRERSDIANDVLVIDIWAETGTHLTLFDLPGLIANDESGAIEATEHLVSNYMAMKQSIILAVVSATQHVINAKILQRVREHDPDWERILGVLTRPDVAENTGKHDWIKVIQGTHEIFQFSGRWHVIRNRTTEELDNNTSMDERDRLENELLFQPPWNTVDAEFLGIQRLRERLRSKLWMATKRELPHLRDKLKTKLVEVTEDLHDLLGNQFEDDDLMRVFRSAAMRLQNVTRDLERGIYKSNIPGFTLNPAIPLRARIAELDDVFCDNMRKRGHAWRTPSELLPADSSEGDPVLAPGPINANATDSGGLPEPRDVKDLETESSNVVRMLHETRGTSLPTFFDPDRINELFWSMSAPWNKIAHAHTMNVYRCCMEYFKAVTPIAFAPSHDRLKTEGFRNSTKVAKRFVRMYVIPELDRCLGEAEEELQRLENDRKDFTKNGTLQFLKDQRRHRHGREFRRVMRAMNGGQDWTSGDGGEDRLDQTTYAQRAQNYTPAQTDGVVAEDFLAAMLSRYVVRSMFLLPPRGYVPAGGGSSPRNFLTTPRAEDRSRCIHYERPEAG